MSKELNNQPIGAERVSSDINGTVVTKNDAFDGSAGNGAVGTVDLFTVTGEVFVKTYAVCTEDLAGATATCEVGISGSTDSIIAQTTATDIDIGEVWHDATPDSGIESSSVATLNIVGNGADIILTVGTANVTDGTIDFYAVWQALSPDGNLIAA